MRYYELDGKYYPSVTTVLGMINKPGLNRWRGEKGNEEADRLMIEAGDVGTLVHNIAEKINSRGWWTHLVTTEEVAKMGEAYEKWFDKNVETVIAVEQVVVNQKYGYAGRVDLVAKIRGDDLPSIIDVKTGGIWPDVFLQLAAYQEALPIKTGRRIIVPIDKKRPGNPIRIKEPANSREEDQRMFLYALELYRYFNNGAINKKDATSIKKSDLAFDGRS